MSKETLGCHGEGSSCVANGIEWARDAGPHTTAPQREIIQSKMSIVLRLRNPELDKTNTSKKINEHGHSNRDQGCRDIRSQSAPGKGMLWRWEGEVRNVSPRGGIKSF